MALTQTLPKLYRYHQLSVFVSVDSQIRLARPAHPNCSGPLKGINKVGLAKALCIILTLLPSDMSVYSVFWPSP